MTGAPELDGVRLIGLAGVAVFAATGALAAARHRMDWVGALVLAGATALGGGTLRDLILGLPVLWTREPVWLAVASGAGLATIITARMWARLERGLRFADALGVAFFSCTGMMKAAQAGFHPALAILMGVVTAMAGGLVRDIVAQRPCEMLYPGQLYVTSSAVGAAAAWLALYFGLPQGAVIAIGVAACLGVRLLSRYGGIRTAAVSGKP
ncbi:MAG: TRIC cation channel family protein [Spirochaetes bacterium]|nr:TRIC cation channel family protein [Spirochaetota bacterium]